MVVVVVELGPGRALHHGVEIGILPKLGRSTDGDCQPKKHIPHCPQPHDTYLIQYEDGKHEPFTKLGESLLLLLEYRREHVLGSNSVHNGDLSVVVYQFTRITALDHCEAKKK